MLGGNAVVNNVISDCQKPALINEIRATTVIVESDTTYVNRLTHKGRGKQDSPSQFENIVLSTRKRIKLLESKPHVSTRAERSSNHLLKQSGLIFIEGKSGSGKTTLGLRILSYIAKAYDRVPVVLSAWQQWDCIPKKTPKKEEGLENQNTSNRKLVMLIDDIYGASNKDPKQLENCERYFNMMWPQAKSRHILFVMTSRSEIAALCKRRLAEYDLMKNARFINLEDRRYSLTTNEKKKMLIRICKLNVGDNKLSEIVKTDASLGFPQCCNFYANSKSARQKGVDFFHNPHEFIIEEIDRIQECDGTGYLVLLTVLMSTGYLEDRQAHAKDDYLKPLINSLRECCHNVPRDLTLYDFHEKAKSLCGVYLTHNGSGYGFQHQSVFDSVFISISRKYLDICIDACPAHMLVELVRTQSEENSSSSDEDTLHVSLPKEHFDVLVDHITDLLMIKDCPDSCILSHPSLQDEEFVQQLVQSWPEETMRTLLLQEHAPTSVFVPHPLKEEENVHLFTYNTMLAAVLLRKLEYVLKYALSRVNSPSKHASNLLACAIYMDDNSCVKTLLELGAVPDENCFRSLCHSQSIDDNLTHTIFKRVEHNVETINDVGGLFGLAIMRGNTTLVKLMMSKLNGSGEDLSLFRMYLEMILDKLGKNQLRFIHRNKGWQLDSDLSRYWDITRVLHTTGCHNDISFLVWLSAAHEDATLLRYFLPKPNVDPLKRYSISGDKDIWKATTPLQQAASYGGADCVQELVNYFKSRGITPSKFLNETALTDSYFDEDSVLGLIVWYERFDIMKLVIEAGIDDRRTDSAGRTLLHEVVAWKHPEGVKYFLKLGIPISQKDNNGYTAFASLYRDKVEIPSLIGERNTHVDIVKLLVEAGSEINELDKFGRSCLQKAAMRGDIETIGYLCERGVDLNQKDMEGKSVLHYAIDECNMEMLQYLVQREADVHAVDDLGRNVIHYATGSPIQTVEKITYFKDVHRVPVSALDSLGRTALFYATESGDEEIVEWCVDMGLDLNHADKEGATPLHLSIQSSNDRDTTLVDFLIQNGADVCAKDTYKRTPLHYAAKECECKELVKMLLENGADPSVKDEDGRTPLHYAARVRGGGKSVEILLQRDVDPGVQDKHGSTPLHNAVVAFGGENNVKLLLDRGADPCVHNRDGCTPLHLAARHVRSQPTFTRLLEKGADLNATDGEGCTPLHYAARRGCKDNVRFLLHSGADVAAVDEEGRCALHYAVMEQCGEEKVMVLLEEGADPCARDKYGRSPLHSAAKQRYCELSIKILLEKGADPSVPDSDGLTPKDYARVSGLQCLL
ncbi:uncharacterized protein LOC124137677 [Haliotis rufescens]|uniref:uncharacterized protein LOC124137677 n=1 Tax=Haliotis rufescens TaxID=6454 RepID=UPI00201FA76A|nr:uncharacterized protein LOC124137677 [Haliotis rufescens]